VPSRIKIPGLRDDLLPKVPAPALAPASRKSKARPHIGVPRENILQLLPEVVTPSKDELASYWRKVSRRALLYLARRPLKLVRRVHGTTFYHKGSLPKEIPDAMHQLRIEKREGGSGTRLWVDNLDGLLGLVQLGAVELHPWNTTVDNFEHADQLVIDLDPGEGIEWEAVIEAARPVRRQCAHHHQDVQAIRAAIYPDFRLEDTFGERPPDERRLRLYRGQGDADLSRCRPAIADNAVVVDWWPTCSPPRPHSSRSTRA
jgi:hypothetical protein